MNAEHGGAQGMRNGQRGSRRTAWRRTAAGAAMAAALAAAGGCAAIPAAGPPVQNPPALVSPVGAQFTTQPVEYGYVQKTIQVAGIIAAARQAAVYFHNGGTIAKLYIQVGQRVRRGQLLARFDTSGDLYAIAQQQLTLRSDQLALQELEAQDRFAAPADPAAAEQQAAALDSARIQVEQDRLQVQEAQLTLQEDEVHAPFAGIVANVDNQVGDSVGAFQVIATIDDTSGYRMIASATSAQAAEASPGDPAVISLSTGQQGNAVNTVVQSIQVPTPEQVAVAKQNAQLGALKSPQLTLVLPHSLHPHPSDIGVAFQAQVTVASANGVLYVPTSDIFSFNGLNYVNVLRNGFVAERPVQLGLVGDQDTVVTSGLSPSDQVVQP